jgi:hypothetical protein
MLYREFSTILEASYPLGDLKMYSWWTVGDCWICVQTMCNHTSVTLSISTYDYFYMHTHTHIPGVNWGSLQFQLNILRFLLACYLSIFINPFPVVRIMALVPLHMCVFPRCNSSSCLPTLGALYLASMWACASVHTCTCTSLPLKQGRESYWFHFCFVLFIFLRQGLPFYVAQATSSILHPPH